MTTAGTVVVAIVVEEDGAVAAVVVVVVVGSVVDVVGSADGVVVAAVVDGIVVTGAARVVVESVAPSLLKHPVSNTAEASNGTTRIERDTEDLLKQGSLHIRPSIGPRRAQLSTSHHAPTPETLVEANHPNRHPCRSPPSAGRIHGPEPNPDLRQTKRKPPH